MNRAFLLMLLFVVAACKSGNQSPQKHDSMDATTGLLKRLNKTVDRVTDLIHGPPRIVARGAKPEIIAKGSEFTFEGQPLRLGDKFENWVKVLGSDYRPSRPNDKYKRLFVWDNLGVRVYLDNAKDAKTVKTFSVELNFKQLYADWNPDSKKYRPGVGVVPAHFFKGYLEVNEVPIDAQSTVREVNRRADGKLSIHCMRGINVCSDHIRPAEDPSINFEVDSRKEDSIIYAVSFSIPRASK